MLKMTRDYINFSTTKKNLPKMATYGTVQQNVSNTSRESCIKGAVMREGIRCTVISAC